MWHWLRNTASLGRSGVPAMRLRMRFRIRFRTSCRVLTFIALTGVPWPRAAGQASPSSSSLRAGGPGLAGLLLEDLADVANALLLVRIRLAQTADLRGDLSDLLAVDAGDHEVSLLLDRDLD